jgi:hypothetical protein
MSTTGIADTPRWARVSPIAFELAQAVPDDGSLPPSAPASRPSRVAGLRRP